MASETKSTRSLFVAGDFSGLQWVAVLAALITAVIHLYLAPRIMQFNATMGYLFVLDGLGYIGGIGLYLTRYWRRSLYLVAILYTVVQIVVWASGGMGGGTIGMVDKAVQVVFIALAGYLYTRT